MSILIRFTPTGMTKQQYDEAIRRLEETGALPPAGSQLHVCFGSDGDLRVSEIWESREQFQAFATTLMPILEDIGIDPGAPEFFEIHALSSGL